MALKNQTKPNLIQHNTVNMNRRRESIMNDTIGARYEQLHRKFTVECTRNHIITDFRVLQDLGWYIEQRVSNHRL